MLNQDPRCVFVAADMAGAAVMANWLTNHGIPAKVMDTMTLGGAEWLKVWPSGVSARGTEVWIDEPDQADEARALLAEHKTALAQKAAAAEQRGPMEVVCEECGETSVFPPSQHGSTQDCPYCGAYLDVEDPKVNDE